VRRVRPGLRAAVAGFLVGACGVAALATEGGGDRARRPPPDATGAFLAAWRRSLVATYSVAWQFERRRPDGSVVVTAVLRRAQRPPDVLVRGPDGVRGRLGGRRVGCLAGPEGEPVCRDGGPAPPYAADVAAELRLLRSLVVGPGAAYRARPGRERGCFVLVLRARLVAPPYGEDATFCFDAGTGAVVRSVVHRAEVTDTHVAVSLRDRVEAADLALPGVPRA
jgi:hypothetical protein